MSISLYKFHAIFVEIFSAISIKEYGENLLLQVQNNKNTNTSTPTSKPFKSTSAMLTTDRHLSVDYTSSSVVTSDARRRSMFRQFSTVQQQQQQQQQQDYESGSSAHNNALARWKKV